MKARAASPDVLVDLSRLEELRSIKVSGDTLHLGAMATYTADHGSSEVDVSRPILAEVAAQIADVQVRNRGTIGGNVCSNDPTNHLPPLLVALGATMTIRGRERRAERDGGGVLPRRLPDGGRRGRAADASPFLRPRTRRTGSPSVTIGRDGTCIVDAAASLAGGSTRIALGCVDAVPVAGSTPAADRRGAFARPLPARRSTRRPTSMRQPTTGAISRRSARCGPSSRQRSEGR